MILVPSWEGRGESLCIILSVRWVDPALMRLESYYELRMRQLMSSSFLSKFVNFALVLACCLPSRNGFFVYQLFKLVLNLSDGFYNF